MSWKDRRRRRRCAKSIRYATEEEALRVAAGLPTIGALNIHQFGASRCTRCHGYHVKRLPRGLVSAQATSK